MKVKRWQHYKRKKPKIAALEKEDCEKIEAPPKAILFVPYTVNGDLASKIRQIIQDLRPWTKMNVKVVERGGQ